MATPLSPGHPPTPGRLRSSLARVAPAAPTTLPERREEAHVVEISGRCKDGVLLRHLLAHTAGLPGWAVRLDGVDLYDWDRVTGLLAEQAPWWEPGTRSGYHGITQGNLVGEVVRRVDGRSVGRFFAEEIAAPLGADFHIGTGAEHDDRIALVIPPPLTEPQTEIEGESAGGTAPSFGGSKINRESIPYRAANP